MNDHLIGLRLEALRKKRDLTQADVAAILGVNDRQIVSNIETGIRKVKADELVRLVEGLGVPLDYFTDPFRLEGEGSFSWRRQGAVKAQILTDYEANAGRWIAAYRALRPRASEPLMRLRLPLEKWSTVAQAAEVGERFAREYALGDVPAANLPKVMEKKLDVLALAVDAPRGVSGAACRLAGLDAVLINRREVPGRRHFDLAHELFHLLTWDAMPPEPVEDADASKGHVEKLADAFASAVLMPKASIEGEWRDSGSMAALAVKINARADALQVTSQALKWRLASTQLLPQATVRAIPDELLRHNGRLESNLEWMPPLFSHGFMSAVGDAIEKGTLSARRVARLLDTGIEELGELFLAHALPSPVAV